MAQMQPVRGTHDLLPAEMRRHRQVVETAREIAERYGYLLMSTPIFEFTEVFKRTLGDTTDIVTKEMYSFEARETEGEGGGQSITLRPENTASVVRAFLSNKLTQDLPQRFFYAGPMFRRERPQKGRQRQFHQIGVELFGVAEPAGDVEVIACGQHIIEELGFAEHIALELNTLGDQESRAAYRTALIDYFQAHREGLSADSRERLERNPLRILDSKDPGDRTVVAGAPAFAAHLTAAASDFFAAVKAGLDSLGIAYKLNPHLVRGLDYYCHTAFEFTTDRLGAQGTVMGGGRYDYLVETMGGPPTAGVGWAAGVERLAMMLAADPPAPRLVALVPIGEAAEAAALPLAQRLRKAGVAVELAASGNVKKRMKRADRIGAYAAILLGEEELATGEATVKTLADGSQQRVAQDRLPELLAALR
ncbi:histidine--tRNA ligase [Thalassobaculum salexigens]|uniref:histidine--tRNA ligase n=1 Tax=Thalassobaculum salexigens TaxID=455360 RepID=UPI00248D9424|nr:histidine--tRNA ligase [Thalassobaculum salexigens]